MSFDISILSDRCIACGRCARSCSTGFLRLRDGQLQAGGRTACIGCGHCVAVCPADAVRLNGEGAVPAPEDTLEQIFLLRRSVRKFRPEPPDKAILQRALDCAQWAPSGKNRHDNRWTVVYGAESCRQVSELALSHCRETGESPELLYLAGKGLDLLTCGAPVLLIGWSPDDALNPCVDAVIAMHTVQMLLEEKGLGCCWGGYLRQITNHSPALKSLLGIPDGCSMQCCMMLGYPSADPYTRIPPRPAAEACWI